MPSQNPLPSASPQDLKPVKVYVCNRTTEPYLLFTIKLVLFFCILSTMCNALTPLYMSRLEYKLSSTGNSYCLFVCLHFERTSTFLFLYK